MYRQYEDPRALEERLEKWLEEHPDRSEWDDFDYETYHNLEDRINFAWQDEEFEENYARDNYDPELEEMMYHEEDWE